MERRKPSPFSHSRRESAVEAAVLISCIGVAHRQANGTIPALANPRSMGYFHYMACDITPDFSSMNETDVREVIVRPLLHDLGFRHGTDAYVRTETTLRYEQAFLGRQNPGKDPALTGRADYICGVVAAGRWVVEVKNPNQPLDEPTIQQAHTYAAHPEVAANYFMLTNGRTFSVYRTAQLDTPVLTWTYAESKKIFLNVLNLIGPDAIRRRARMELVDPGEPLGIGMNSRLTILNGSMQYDDYPNGKQPPFLSSLAGVQLPVTGGWVARDDDRGIHVCVDLSTVSPLLKMAGAVGLNDQYDFYSWSSHISTEEEHPTIFQNRTRTCMNRGTSVTFAGMRTLVPCSIETDAFTQVVGFVRGQEFQGSVRIETEIEIGPMDSMVGFVLSNQFGMTPGKHLTVQTGRFSARFASVI